MESINRDLKNAELGKDEYAKIEEIIANGGFNYYEFVVINAKIGSIFSILKAQSGTENLTENSQELTNDGTGKLQKNWAKKIMKSTKKITGLFISEEDIVIVKKYEDKILETYTGFQIPELPNGKFPKLNFEQYK